MELLFIGEAARRLGVHPNRLRAWEKPARLYGARGSRKIRERLRGLIRDAEEAREGQI
ncbi:MAG TPA: transposase [Firmicutes bacterium]|nr:transposase [Candidatus Fermentithermobacillaceae bacterium]